MKTFKQYINEAKYSELYFDSYTGAIDYALSQVKKKYQVDAEEVAQIVGLNSQRPKNGKTTKVSIPLYKDGKLQRKSLHIQVYNRGTDNNPFELNFYIL